MSNFSKLHNDDNYNSSVKYFDMIQNCEMIIFNSNIRYICMFRCLFSYVWI